MPDTIKTLPPVKLDEKTQFIGVVAYFSDDQATEWKQIETVEGTGHHYRLLVHLRQSSIEMKKEDLLNHAAVVVSWSFSDLIDKKGTLLIGMVDRKGQSTVVNAFISRHIFPGTFVIPLPNVTFVNDVHPSNGSELLTLVTAAGIRTSPRDIQSRKA